MLLFYPCLLVCLIRLALGAEDYYRLLEIDRQASERDIKRAYRTLSKKYHPDKNPGNDSAHKKFVEVSEAYEALSDRDTRQIYDQYGHEGLAQHRQGGGGGGGGPAGPFRDPFDLFSRFFGGGGHFGGGGGGGQRRGPNMEVTVTLPLRDFYTGRETEFSVEKQQICEACEGSGSADGVLDACEACAGHGVVIQKHMLAPGIFQQVQSVCGRCGGKGQTIRRPCPACAGTRVVRRLATHSLAVERGMPVGMRLTYENEADESPDWVAGDLVVKLAEQAPVLATAAETEADPEPDHPLRTDATFFRRKAADLYWTEVLSLREAWLGGWTRNLTHLDGHLVRLSRPAAHLVQPGTVEVLAGQGMPRWDPDGDRPDADGAYGRLLVEYVVVLPDRLPAPMYADFGALWDRWRPKLRTDGGPGRVHLDADSGRPVHASHDQTKDEL
ncbi:MAG: DnaJ- protein scj1 [Phylliscum demangeonii]|nr:MAG: DnaJ- protein scj1 [Phylliscum demangeonii]